MRSTLLWLLVLPIATACGDDKDVNTVITGSTVVYCSLTVSEIVSCTETTNATEALAAQIIEQCEAQEAGTTAASAIGECPNKEQAPGVCALPVDASGLTSFNYQSGDLVSADFAETFCVSENGTFTANDS